ncbi:hypothetical protein [Arthrobacter burdickii]|uniref:Uncharacterized protein n=1 Tax=Arthrobacter burdickii TaxID=3035920 RepID=A0ABT8K6G3_9MICC|nr:hypothetical protein [Arthrobacter burdickii]MDN4611939.1 hypothetical protein [Arthrobacter burdickii]
MSTFDWVILSLWVALACACILNWTAQARWHALYREDLQRVIEGKAMNYQLFKLGERHADD